MQTDQTVRLKFFIVKQGSSNILESLVYFKRERVLEREKVVVLYLLAENKIYHCVVLPLPFIRRRIMYVFSP